MQRRSVSQAGGVSVSSPFKPTLVACLCSWVPFWQVCQRSRWFRTHRILSTTLQASVGLRSRRLSFFGKSYSIAAHCSSVIICVSLFWRLGLSRVTRGEHFHLNERKACPYGQAQISLGENRVGELSLRHELHLRDESSDTSGRDLCNQTVLVVPR
jgi:hypothetical protein